MKRIAILLAGIMLFASSVFANNDSNEVKVPKMSPITQSTLKTYFPGKEIVKANKIKSKAKNVLELWLDDGAYLQFDKDGQWIHVEYDKGAVPQAMIPGKIQMYLHTKYPDGNVVKMLKDKKGNYEIHLIDGTTLLFDNQMKFMNAE